LEKIERKAPDVILLDLNLPDMNGLEIARLARQNEKTSRTPILAMSGSCSAMDKIKCLEIGCNDFIHKPFSVRSLLVRLSALIPIRSHSTKTRASSPSRQLVALGFYHGRKKGSYESRVCQREASNSSTAFLLPRSKMLQENNPLEVGQNVSL
jgi:DNA-binding response OmpR family regulator